MTEEWVIPLAFGMAGAVMNRVRGGWLALPGKRLLHAGIFGVFMLLLTGTVIPGFLAAVGMFVGQMPGWGRYIGALGGWETKLLRGWPPLDLILRPLKLTRFWWGWWGLSLRGLWWGVCLIPATTSFWPMAAGFLMPLVYLVTIRSCRFARTNNPDGQGWEWGEVVFGALLWVSVTLG